MLKNFDHLPVPAQAVILMGAAVALAAGGFFFGIPGVSDSASSLASTRDRLKMQIYKLKNENAYNEAVLSRLTEYVSQIEEMKKRLEVIRTILPDEPATDPFKHMAERAALAAGVRIQTIEPKALVARDFYLEVPVALRLDGPYFSLLNFFNRLTRLQRMVSVSELSLSPTAAGLSVGYGIRPNQPVEATCVVTTYCLCLRPPPLSKPSP